MNNLRSLVLSLLVVLVAVLAYGYLSGATWSPFTPQPASAEAARIETAKARGAEMGEKVAIAAAKVKETAEEAALTSKIKAKMVLDDHIKARSIDVSTDGSTVTLSGVVRSDDEHARAVRLARETAGITRVVDRIRVEIQ